MSDSMKTVFETALQTVQSDVSGMVEIALPIGLGIAGLFMAITLGVGFFKNLAH